MVAQDVIRCDWINGSNKPHYVAYHDEEWGVPIYDDQKLFEMLILEGAQAGLSWETILKRRDGYRQAFKNFDPLQLAQISDEELEQQLKNPNIIRNRLKVYSVRKNAIAFLNIQQEFGSFSEYLWRFVDYRPVVSRPKSMQELASKSRLSDRISKDLKKRGMSFVGSSIIYAYLQAVGVLDEHMQHCFKATS